MLEVVNVAGLGIRKELGCIQWQLRMVHRLSASRFMVFYIWVSVHHKSIILVY